MSRLRALLFYLVVLFLPSQLGLHFWPNFAYVSGIRVDYLSPTIYLTDILIGILFLLWLLQKKSEIRNKTKTSNPCLAGRRVTPKTFLLVVLVFISSIGIISSLSPIAGIYKLIKILEFVFFGFAVAKNIRAKKDFITVAFLFAAGIIFESGLTIWQFINQSSIGGVFWFLGERTFSGQTPGIANANIDGRLVLRPYGTFPHPNVLAGYLIIMMTIISSKFKKTLFVAAIILGTLALLLTLSRVAIVLWLIVLYSWLANHIFRKWKMVNDKWKIVLLAILVFIGIIGSIYFSPLPSRFASITNVDRESFVLRREFNRAAVEMFKSSPLFGVGLNNFLINLPRRQAGLPRYQKIQTGTMWLQPAHNIFLLVAAETGLVGLSIFLWFILQTVKQLKKKKEFSIFNFQFSILFLVLILGFFDHYFLTLQQGQLLLALIFGLFWSPVFRVLRA